MGIIVIYDYFDYYQVQSGQGGSVSYCRLGVVWLDFVLFSA